jgi:hypothetical protein
MTNQKNEAVPEGRLLSDQEREAFKMISTGKDLHGQRAIALLAVDEGATQEEAALRAGLTAGQVKYWLGKFRRVRMDIFPEQVLKTEQLDLDQGAPVAGKPKKKQKAKKSQGKKKKPAKKSKTKKGKKPKSKTGKDKTKKKGKGKKKKNKK